MSCPTCINGCPACEPAKVSRHATKSEDYERDTYYIGETESEAARMVYVPIEDHDDANDLYYKWLRSWAPARSGDCKVTDSRFSAMTRALI